MDLSIIISLISDIVDIGDANSLVENLIRDILLRRQKKNLFFPSDLTDKFVTPSFVVHFKQLLLQI